MRSFTLSAAILASLPIFAPSVLAQSSAAASTSVVASSSTSDIVPATSSATASTVLSSSTSADAPPLSSSSSSSGLYVSTSIYISSSSVALVPQPSISPIGNYYFQGCYVEPPNARILTSLVNAADNMTLESCSASCAGTYQYFGLEFGRECWCGYTLNGAVKTTQDQCNMPCSGSSSEMCGAGNTLSLYTSKTLISAPPPAPLPAVPAKVGPYTAQGCVTEAADFQRALTGYMIADPKMTNEMCASVCAGLSFIYFGTEYSDECWCGNTLAPSANATAASECSMSCAGNSTEACGGPNHLDLYCIIGGVAPTPSPVPTPTPAPVQSSSSSIKTSTTLVVAPISSSSAVALSSSIKTSTTIIVLPVSSSTEVAAVAGSSSSIKPIVSSSSKSIVQSPSSAPKSTSTLVAIVLSSSSTKLTSTIASTSAKTTTSSFSSTTKFSSSSKSTFLTVASKTTSSAKSSGTWVSEGCFQDTKKGLMTKITKGKTMNLQVCISAAAAAATAKKPVTYAFIGLENGQTCLGATAAPTATSLAGTGACTVPCAGNVKGGPVQTCGGKLQYNMYASMAVGGANVAAINYPVPALNPDANGYYDNSS